jgi:addiction module HigA family antidote
MRRSTHRAPTPPGEILLEEWLKPMTLTQLALAKKMGVDIQLVNGIVDGRRSLTAKTALLLAKVLKTTPEFWLNAQMAVDLSHAQQECAGDGCGAAGLLRRIRRVHRCRRLLFRFVIRKRCFFRPIGRTRPKVLENGNFLSPTYPRVERKPLATTVTGRPFRLMTMALSPTRVPF